MGEEGGILASSQVGGGRRGTEPREEKKTSGSVYISRKGHRQNNQLIIIKERVDRKRYPDSWDVREGEADTATNRAGPIPQKASQKPITTLPRNDLYNAG